MAIVLRLLAALSWGTGDFTGGMATRRAAETAVVLGTETIGLLLILVVAPFAGGSPHTSDLVLGAPNMQDETRTCDAISFGFAFTMKPTTPFAAPNSCTVR